MHTIQSQTVPFPSAARAASANGDAMKNRTGRGVALFLEITAVSGTDPTLDVKLQVRDPVANQWHDLPGAAFAQKTGTGRDTLTVYPGVAETANETVSDVLPADWRAVATIGGTDTPTFTFSVAGYYIP